MGADVERSGLKDGSIYTGIEGLMMLRRIGDEIINEISDSIRFGQQAGYSFLSEYFRTADSC
ncbi:MAG: hypothetical protein ACQEWT_04470 [Bacillota bacterium]